MFESSLSSRDPSNSVSPSRKSDIENLLSEDLTPYNETLNEEGLFCVRWTPPVDNYFDFISIFRQTLNVPLGGTRKSKYTYTDSTITSVMSVGSKDSRSSLPQRITLSNFKLGMPITSYGCICRYEPKNNEDKENNENKENKDNENKDNDNKEPEYLLIKRNDSVSYIDLIRGSYRDSQLFFMIQDLPENERDRLIKYNYDDLWEDLHLKIAEGDAYEFGKSKFSKIKEHFPPLFEKFPSRDPNGKYLWLFPKGKPDYRPLSEYEVSEHTIIQTKENYYIDPDRIIPESPFECALREFNEETNGCVLAENDLLFQDPIIERYLGSNSKNYQTNYFIFNCETKSEIEQFPRSQTQIREVSVDEVDQILWVPYSKLNEYLCPARQELCHYIETHYPTDSPNTINPNWKYPAELSEFSVD